MVVSSQVGLRPGSGRAAVEMDDGSAMGRHSFGSVRVFLCKFTVSNSRIMWTTTML